MEEREIEHMRSLKKTKSKEYEPFPDDDQKYWFGPKTNPEAHTAQMNDANLSKLYQLKIRNKGRYSHREHTDLKKILVPVGTYCFIK